MAEGDLLIFKPRICPYFLRSNCREGDNCKRSHDISSWTPASMPVCGYFLNSKCKYNDECWYSHIPSSTQTIPAKKPYTFDVPTVEGKPVYQITIVPTRKPKKTPFKGKTYADSLPCNLRDGVKGLSKVKLCPYHMTNQCPFAERCRNIHGNLCDICKYNCLHPYNGKQRISHKAECRKQLERTIEIATAVQRSREKICGICMDVVIEKLPLSDRQFGILEKCNHVFCLECIRKWRRVKQFEGENLFQTVVNPIVTRACPQCRIRSDFITPSLYWVEGDAKDKMIRDYKSALSRKHCKYFKRGEGTCPFGGVCFYLHADVEGNKVVLPPPSKRKRYNLDGEVDFMTVYSLWDYMEEQDEDNIDWVTLEEILSFYEEP